MNQLFYNISNTINAAVNLIFSLLLRAQYANDQNRAPCWTKQRKQFSRDVIHVSVLQQIMFNDQSQRT